MEHYFHCMFGDTQIHKNFGYAQNHRFGIFLPKPFPHVHMNDWHFTPPNVNSLHLSQCRLIGDRCVAQRTCRVRPSTYSHAQRRTCPLRGRCAASRSPLLSFPFTVSLCPSAKPRPQVGAETIIMLAHFPARGKRRGVVAQSRLPMSCETSEVSPSRLPPPIPCASGDLVAVRSLGQTDRGARVGRGPAR
jgi:hypothetical protein